MKYDYRRITDYHFSEEMKAAASYFFDSNKVNLFGSPTPFAYAYLSLDEETIYFITVESPHLLSCQDSQLMITLRRLIGGKVYNVSGFMEYRGYDGALDRLEEVLDSEFAALVAANQGNLILKELEHML